MSESNEGGYSVRYEMMRPQEILAARDREPVAYVPLGPLEWHGPHLPFGVDMLHAYTIALQCAREMGGVVLPPLPLGTETVLEPDRVRDRGFEGTERIVGMDFPGLSLPSLYIQETALGVILHDLVRALKVQRFKVIVLCNGHGARHHQGMLMRVAVEETEPGKVAVLHALAFDVSPGKGGHAERYETGFMRAYYPDTVDLDALPSLPIPIKNVETGILDGPTCKAKPMPDFTVRPEQDPRNSSVEEGLEDVRNAVQRIGKQVQEALATYSDPNYPAWSRSRILGGDWPLDPPRLYPAIEIE